MTLSSLGGKHRRKASGAWQFGASGSQSLSVGSKVSGCRRIRALTLCVCSGRPRGYRDQLAPKVWGAVCVPGPSQGWSPRLASPKPAYPAHLALPSGTTKNALVQVSPFPLYLLIGPSASPPGPAPLLLEAVTVFSVATVSSSVGLILPE